MPAALKKALIVLALACAAAPAAALAGGRRPPAVAALPSSAQLQADRATFSVLADRGIAVAQRRWWDRHRRWYDNRLNDHERYPLATIWSSVGLFEALDARAATTHSRHDLAAVRAFAAGAERYFTRFVGGYAPYPQDRHPARVWFDDNGWWGLAFLDAYTATGKRRYLADAARAFRFIAASGWAPDGGLWWNTSHPYKAGEALAAGSLLGARLFLATGDSFYRDQVEKFLAWGDQSLWNSRAQLYSRSDLDPSAIPYVNGPLIAAQATLCLATGDQSRCARAESLAGNAEAQWGDNLHMGPQFDVIYVRSMLYLYGIDHDPRWYEIAYTNAQRALRNAVTGPNLYLNAWDGTPATAHQAQPGMLQTQAATVDLFAALAEASPP